MIERSAPWAMLRSDAPDIRAMRAAAAALLEPDEPLPGFDELDETVRRLRGHLQVLIPLVEDVTRALPVGDAGRVAPLVAVENARVCLGSGAGPGLVSAVKHARSLARELRALCDHHERIGSLSAGGRVCPPAMP